MSVFAENDGMFPYMNTCYTNPILLTSAGKIGVINADGSGEQYFDFGVPGQASWGLGPAFPDGERIILVSYEENSIQKIVVGDLLTHIWIYHFPTGSIQEILDRHRPARFTGCAGILGNDRYLLTALIDGENRVFLSNRDGSEKTEITTEGEGFVYGIHLSPDQKRISYHITGTKKAKARRTHSFRPGPYAINVIGIDRANRVLVAGQPGHLYFDPVWSPDGEWLAYLDCLAEADPAHFAADLCIGRPDGTEHRVVTEGQSHWFGSSYGSEGNRGGGSNTTQWSPDGRTLLYTRLAPGSHADCYYDARLPDHQELVYRPELARGGTQLCTLDPCTGEITELTTWEDGKWEHHACYTQGGGSLVYGRACVGQDSELWIMEKDGSHERLLTCGFEGRGAWGHPWPRPLSLSPGGGIRIHY
jgi:hypothetical protein